MYTNTLKHTVDTLKPSLLMAISNCILSGMLLTSLNTYAQDLSRQALDAAPFWIQIEQLNKEVDPPAINLSSIKTTKQNPEWRTVDFYDSWAHVDLSEGYAKNTLTLKSNNIPSTALTVDCTNYTVQGGLPLTEYDRQNITTDPKNSPLRTVIAKDTLQTFGESIHIYRYTFHCQNKTLHQNNHYVIKNGNMAYDETHYEAFANLQVVDDATGQTAQVELISRDIESQSEDLIYIFQQVCK